MLQPDRHISARELILLAAYAMFLALVGFLLWGDYLGTLPGLSPSTAPDALETLAHVLPFPLTLLACGGISWFRRNSPLDARNCTPLCLVVLALFEISGVLLFIAATTGAYGPISQALVPILIGCGGALTFILFQRSLAQLSLWSAGIVVIGSATASAPIYFLMMLLPPTARTVVSFAVLVPVCLLLIIVVNRSATAPSVVPISSKAIAHLRGTLIQPLVNISLSAVVVGILNTVPQDMRALEVANTVKMAGLAISGIALFFVWRRYGERLAFDVLYRWAFPLVAAAYLLLPALFSSYAFLLIGFSYTVFSIASALMVLTCLQAAQKHSVDEIAVYGLFAGIVYLCLSLGSLIGSAVVSTSWNGVPVLLVVALVAVYALAMFDRRAKRPALTDEHGTISASFGDSGTDTNTNVGTGTNIGVTVNTDTNEPVHQEKYHEQGISLGLSPREIEVLDLLAHGRDVPTIARILGVSENTVRTHTKSIYAKADVHTKQELLDKLEA